MVAAKDCTFFIGDSSCFACVHICRTWDFLVKLPGFPRWVFN